MTRQLDKMSEMMQEMSEHLLRISTTPPSSEAMHVALFFASTAWNESVGLTYSRDGYRQVWETMEAHNPAVSGLLVWPFSSNRVSPLRGLDALVSCTRGGAPRLPPLRSAPGCHIVPRGGRKTFDRSLPLSFSP